MVFNEGMETNTKPRTETASVSVEFMFELRDFMRRDDIVRRNLAKPDVETESVIWHDRAGAEVFRQGEFLGLVRHTSATQIEWTDLGVKALDAATHARVKVTV